MEDKKLTEYSRKEMHSLRNYITQGAFTALYSLVKYNSFPLFNYVRYAIIRIFTSSIKSTYISDGVTFWFPAKIKIGKNSSLNQGVIINGIGDVEIGNGVRIAAYTVINSTDHEFKDRDSDIAEQGFVLGKVVIEDDVWIGARVVINKGVTIGKGSIIGAGSVVTRDIPPYSVAVGVPCKVVSTR